MDVREINKLKDSMSIMEFGEVAMKAGQEGLHEDVAKEGNTEEELHRKKSAKPQPAAKSEVAPAKSGSKKPSKIELKRQLILNAAANLSTISDSQLRKIGLALAS